jgi:hypothetical protein
MPAITIPPAEELRRQINTRRDEISRLKKLLKIAVVAEPIKHILDSSTSTQTRKEASHAA